MSRSQQQGFTLIELLIAAAIFGVLMATLGAFFTLNQKVTTEQITAATINKSAKLAQLRMTEVVSQAAYIYPPGQTLTINSASYTTGENALAVLVPEGTPYCVGTTTNYCGYLFSFSPRAPYASILGPGGNTTTTALIETKVTGITWPVNNLPSLSWGAAIYQGPLVDSVDTTGAFPAAAGDPNSKASFLMWTNSEGLKIAPAGGLDKSVLETDPATALDAPDVALNGVLTKLTLSYSLRGDSINVSSSNFFHARTAPRSSLPNQD